MYLFLEADRLSSLGATVGKSLHDTVRESLVWRDGKSAFGGWHTALRDWEGGGKIGTPPFLALLEILTAAAAAMVADAEFSSNNYRDRLCALLELEGPWADRLKRDIPDTVVFWEALNHWLEDLDGAVGLATARVIGRLVNVGYPMSQALVREADRRAMRTAFSQYGLQPHRRVPPAEMLEYLSDWIGRGHASSNLTRLWSDTSTRERIAMVACDELEHGTGETRSETGRGDAAPSGKLEWIVELALEPYPRIQLYLTAPQSSGAAGPTAIASRSDTNGRAAVAGCEAQLELRLLPDLGALSLEPWDEVGLASLFSGVLELMPINAPELRLIRSPTAVIALAYDERDGRFHEVPRAQLLEQCMVLAHESIAGAVDKHLTVYGRPGYRKLTQDGLRELPLGWTAFCGVVLVQAADETHHKRLGSLCASPATMLNTLGGLRLGQSTWHSHRPPELLATVDGDSATFRIVMVGASGAVAIGSFRGQAVVDLSLLNLADGEYEFRIERPKSGDWVVVRRLSIRLRSAESPRPVGVRRDLGLRFEMNRPWSLLSASQGTTPTANGLRGAVAYGLSEHTQPARVVAQLAPPSRRTYDDGDRSRRARDEEGTQPHQCTIGPHYWICEPGVLGDDYKTLKWQECKHCHRFEWTRNRGVVRSARGRSPHQAAVRTPRSAPQLPRYAKRSQSEADSFDLLLNAATYVGSGTVQAFRQLCAVLNDDPTFARNALRSLSALGHIDVEYDRSSALPRRWQVTPPALVQTSVRDWVVVGARSVALIDSIQSILGVEGTLSPLRSGAGPTTWLFQGTISRSSRERLREMVTPVGVGVETSQNIAARIVESAIPLAHIVGELPVVQPPTLGLERFDFDGLCWTGAAFDRPGAYRFDHWGRTYGFADPLHIGEGTVRVAEPSLVKHLAAQAARLTILEHDPKSRNLYVPLGMELPTILERAAVLSSGTLPRLRSDLGQLEYANISLDLALSIQDKLGRHF